MRDVDWGWLIRYLHSTGASAFFIVVYLHMFRGLLYGSYKKPRELVWIIGMFIYLALMAEAFFGYLLPWGNMSYWGAQVIVSLFGAVPVIGNELAEWIRGDFYISDITLNRFFAFHVIAVPLMLVLLVVVHIMALHEVGSNNPDGIEIKEHKGPDGKPIDGVAFHPYHTSKDLVIIIIFLIAVLGRRVLRSRHGRLLPRAREFRAGRSAANAGAHRAGVVLHAVLRDLARRAEQAARRRADGLGRAAAVLPAVARPLPREVDPLSQLDLQSRADVFAIRFVTLGYLGLAARDGRRADVVAGLHDHLFRVLPVHAVLHAHREDQAGSDEGHVVRNAVIAFVLARRCSRAPPPRSTKPSSSRRTPTSRTRRRCSAARSTS